jgi:predicted nucleic acid-binding protein
MERNWLPPKDSYVVLDTNICIYMQSKECDFFSATNNLIDTIAKSGATIVIPQVVRSEIQRNTRNRKEYDQKQQFCDLYDNFLMTSDVVDAASRLQALYCWNPKTKQHGQTNIFSDMIIGTITCLLEHKTKKKAYILSADQDYIPPYFDIESYYLFDNIEKRKAGYCFLYHPNIDRIKIDWQKSFSS